VEPKNVIDTAYEMGISKDRHLPDVASIGLGAGEVTPLDMATAYAPLSNGGYRVTPQAIFKIVTPGGKEEVFAPKRTRIFSDGVAYEVSRILQANVTGGTGTGAQIGVPVAGKTGTTDDFSNAWFVGYTPEYSTAVWVGYPDQNRAMYSVHGIAVAGGTFPASIWADFMRAVIARYGESGSFPLPNDPVSWSPFSSAFTRAAGLANSTRSAASSSSSASTGSTSTAPGTGIQLPQPPAPPSVPASPSPSPTPGTPTPTPPAPTPAPPTVAPTPPPPPATTPPAPPPTTP
jgi:membrane peptidoglycan carboxypeptidase